MCLYTFCAIYFSFDVKAGKKYLFFYVFLLPIFFLYFFIFCFLFVSSSCCLESPTAILPSPPPPDCGIIFKFKFAAWQTANTKYSRYKYKMQNLEQKCKIRQFSYICEKSGPLGSYFTTGDVEIRLISGKRYCAELFEEDIHQNELFRNISNRNIRIRNDHHILKSFST